MLVLSDMKLLFLNKQFMLEGVAFLMTYNGMNVLLFIGNIRKFETGTVRFCSKVSRFLRNIT